MLSFECKKELGRDAEKNGNDRIPEAVAVIDKDTHPQGRRYRTDIEAKFFIKKPIVKNMQKNTRHHS